MKGEGTKGKGGRGNSPAATRHSSPVSRHFVPPTAAEVAEYAAGLGYAIDAGHFCDYWEARGWEVRPRIKMKDWRAAVRNWRRQAASWAKEKAAPQGKPDAAEIEAHREEVAEGVAKQLFEEMLFWVKLSRQDDDEGRERRGEAREKIAETAARAKRLGGKRALDLLREAVKEMLTRRRGGAGGRLTVWPFDRLTVSPFDRSCRPVDPPSSNDPTVQRSNGPTTGKAEFCVLRGVWPPGRGKMPQRGAERFATALQRLPGAVAGRVTRDE